MTQTLHDSGERRTFSSGAQRDRGTFKPRPDLISPHAQMREGVIFALGAEKYEERNWEKGMPISQCLASAQRHIEQWKLGLKDEDHLAQARWNLGAILHYEEEIKAGRMDPAFADMPHYTQQAVQVVSSQVYPACPKCNAALTNMVYETGQEYYCEECGWNSLVVDERATFYICGPMRGLPFLNFPAFDRARDFGRSLGYDIISPADMDRRHGIDPIKDPASPERVRDATPDFVKSVVKRDVEVILRLQSGDGLALLPGWQKSIGAMAEVRLAYWLGLKFVDARDWKPIDMDAELEMER